MRILALDPGPEQTGFVLYDHGNHIAESGVDLNQNILMRFGTYTGALTLAIEMIASYGMAVGKETFETCVWIGRFQQAWRNPDAVRRVYRREVKLHLCQSMRAKDTNIRQALIDRLGPVGTKKNPGPLYGVSGHAWAALAVAVTVADSLP